MADIKKYPYLAYDGQNIPYGDDSVCVGDELPEGWKKLFYKACDDINTILTASCIPLESFHFLQVKEKFGSIRCYWLLAPTEVLPTDVIDSAEDCIRDILSDLENESGQTCTMCGEPATLQSTGWVLPYCRSCAEKAQAAANERHKTSFTVDQTYQPL